MFKKSSFIHLSKVFFYNNSMINFDNVIPSETTQFLDKKNSWSLIFFSVKYTSIGPIRVHNTEYQPPVTSGSRVTGCANFVN